MKPVIQQNMQQRLLHTKNVFHDTNVQMCSVTQCTNSVSLWTKLFDERS